MIGQPQRAAPADAGGAAPATGAVPLAAAPRSDARPAVRIAQVTKRFGAATAVDDVTIDCADGELVTLLGPSGCGKTTLLRIVAGLERPTAGVVEIDGEDVTDAPPERRPVNLVFQRWALFPHKTVLQNVTFGLEAERVRPREARERALEALALCRMDGFASREIHELSGGQAQRVAVARALVKRPKVLLLDEPLASLDLKLRRHMQLELRRLQQSLGMTFLYVTHDQDEALTLSDSIVVLHDGRVEQHSSPRALYDRPRTFFAATFVGEANVLACTVLSSGNGRASVDVHGAAIEASGGDGLAPGAAARLCVRPEAIRLAPDGGLDATVEEVIFAGPLVRYTVRLRAEPDVLLAVAKPLAAAEPMLDPGASVSLEWDPDAGRLFAA